MVIIHYIKIIIRTLRIWCIHSYHHIGIKSGLYNISLSTKIYGKDSGRIQLGKRITTSKNVILVAVRGEIIINDNCSFSGNSTVVSHEKITIGHNCMFGPGVKIYDHDHLFDDSGVLPEGYKSSPITIGSKCWIGANAVILRGTDIGEGSIIGAGTIVKGKIPSHSIVTNDRSMIIKPIR